jgi:hypothetical protein
VIVTEAVAVTVEQPADANVVYVTIYDPGVDVLGVMAPEVVLIERPVGVTEYVPLVYAPEPVNVTFCAVDKEVQRGEV